MFSLMAIFIFSAQTTYPERTKHCGLCNVCYKGLDHHCLFIMTCVAINNHGSFLAMILSVFAAQSLFVRGAAICEYSLVIFQCMLLAYGPGSHKLSNLPKRPSFCLHQTM